MMWLLIIYFASGLAWTILTFITFMDTFANNKEAVVCLVVNLFFWPLILVLAIAAGKFKNT